MPLILGGRYLPQTLLGQNAFGKVYLGLDRYAPTLKACKIQQFHPVDKSSEGAETIGFDPTALEQAAATLEDLSNAHPQIPKVFAFFPLTVEGETPEEFFYLVQEWIEGETLADLLQQQGPFAPQDVLQVLVEALRVLQGLHDRQFIHQHLQPAALIRDRQGKLWFNMMHQFPDPRPHPHQDSLDYAACEQIRGGSVYPSTDLYRLGVICIVLLTGRSPQELYDAYHGSWTYRDLVQIPDRFAQVLDRLLEPIPSQRFRSANEVLQALQGKASTSAQTPNIAQKAHSENPHPLTTSRPQAPSAEPLWKKNPEPQAQSTSNPSPSKKPSQTPNPVRVASSLEKPRSPSVSEEETQNPVRVASPKEKLQIPNSELQTPNSELRIPNSPNPELQTPNSELQTPNSELQIPNSEFTQPRTQKKPFTSWEILASAAFTGAEGAMLAIVIGSTISSPWLGAGIWLLLALGLVAMQRQRFIEKIDLAILFGLSLGVLWLVPGLRSVLVGSMGAIVLITVLAGLGGIVVTAIFQLIYSLLRQFL
jgi:serine/threonine protein kinase